MKPVPTIALVAMLAGCAAAAPGWDTKHTVTGVLTVRGSTLGGGCIPEYEFIREGARVRLSYPDDDSTIGESSLGPITPLLLETTPDARSWTRSMKCTSTFTVTGVPEVPWYYVEMGGERLVYMGKCEHDVYRLTRPNLPPLEQCWSILADWTVETSTHADP